jgi:hypothetical protein
MFVKSHITVDHQIFIHIILIQRTQAPICMAPDPSTTVPCNC